MMILRGGRVAAILIVASAHICVVLLQDCWVARPVDHMVIWWFDDLSIYMMIWWRDVTMLCWWYKDLSLSSLIHPQLRITLSSPRTERQTFKFFNSIVFENNLPMRDSKIIIRQHKFSLATISLKKSFKLSLFYAFTLLTGGIHLPMCAIAYCLNLKAVRFI